MIKDKYIDGVPQFYPGCEHPLVEPVTPADVLAYVQAGVESGTIKGEVVQASYDDDWLADHDHSLPVSKGGTYIVIGPVSDGGSET